jgi:hypothetical protein
LSTKVGCKRPASYHYLWLFVVAKTIMIGDDSIRIENGILQRKLIEETR